MVVTVVTVGTSWNHTESDSVETGRDWSQLVVAPERNGAAKKQWRATMVEESVMVCGGDGSRESFLTNGSV